MRTFRKRRAGLSATAGLSCRITEKPTTDCISPYNNAGLISKVYEKIAIETLKFAVVDNPTVVTRLTPPPGEPPWIFAKSYTARNSSHWPTFLPLIVYGSIFIVVGSERRIFFATECVSAVQGHPRSLNQGRVVYDLLLRLRLMTNRKLHMRFRSVPKIMNDLDGHDALCFETHTRLSEPITKIWMTIRPILSSTKMYVVSCKDNVQLDYAICLYLI